MDLVKYRYFTKIPFYIYRLCIVTALDNRKNTGLVIMPIAGNSQRHYVCPSVWPPNLTWTQYIKKEFLQIWHNLQFRFNDELISGGQRSEVKALATSTSSNYCELIFQKCIEGISSHIAQIVTWGQWYTVNLAKGHCDFLVNAVSQRRQERIYHSGTNIYLESCINLFRILVWTDMLVKYDISD